MSSETYDLLKRPDEFFVVNKAHHNPKFVEDVVRGILARALEMYADFGDETFVFASQINYESIHKHDAFAEGFGLFGELRARAARRLARGIEDRSGNLASHAPVRNYERRGSLRLTLRKAISRSLRVFCSFAIAAAMADCGDRNHRLRRGSCRQRWAH